MNKKIDETIRNLPIVQKIDSIMKDDVDINDRQNA